MKTYAPERKQNAQKRSYNPQNNSSMFTQPTTDNQALIQFMSQRNSGTDMLSAASASCDPDLLNKIKSRAVYRDKSASPAAKPKQTSDTGIPAQMQQKFEERSGFSYDDVRVHYNSDKPAELGALAYTQGNQVYIAPGQEEHLEHELGHVAQQKAGVVRATGSVDGFSINSDNALEQNTYPLALMSAMHISNRNPIIQFCKGKYKRKAKKNQNKSNKKRKAKKIAIDIGAKDITKKISNRKIKVLTRKRGPTTFGKTLGNNNQGPHTLPFVLNSVLVHTMQEIDFDPVYLDGTRLLLSPKAATKNMAKHLELAKKNGNKHPVSLDRYSESYKNQYIKVITGKSIQDSIFEYGKLLDLLPTQSAVVGRLANKDELKGKGERSHSVAKQVLNYDDKYIDYLGATPHMKVSVK